MKDLILRYLIQKLSGLLVHNKEVHSDFEIKSSKGVTVAKVTVDIPKELCIGPNKADAWCGYLSQLVTDETKATKRFLEDQANIQIDDMFEKTYGDIIPIQ